MPGLIRSVLLLLAVAKVCVADADFCILFKFDYLINKGGIIMEGERTCDPDSDCDTKLQVCLSPMKSNCTESQSTKTFENANSVFFNESANEESNNFTFCEKGQLPDQIYANIRVLDSDGQAENDSSAELIFRRVAPIKIASLKERKWSILGNSKTNDTVKIQFLVKIQCISSWCGDSQRRNSVSKAVSDALAASSFRVTSHQAAVYTVTPSNSEIGQVSNVKNSPLKSDNQVQNDGLVVPWWVVTGSIGACIGGLIVAVAAVLNRKKCSKHFALAEKGRVKGRVSKISSRNTYSLDDAAFTRSDSVQSGRSGEYAQIDSIIGNSKGENVAESSEEESIYNEPNQVYDIPRNQSVTASAVNLEEASNDADESQVNKSFDEC